MKSLSAISCCIVLLCIVLFTSFVASCTGEQEKNNVARLSSSVVATDTTLLTTIADDDKPPQAIPGHATDPESQNQPASFQVVFSESGRGVAYVANKGGKFYVVYNQPLFSPDGRYVVYRARKDGKRFVVAADAKNGKIIRKHPSYEQVFQPIFT